MEALSSTPPAVLMCALLATTIALGLVAFFRPVLFNGGKFPSVPGGNFIVGHALHFLNLDTIVDVVDDWCDKYGIVEYRIMDQRFLLLSDPKEVAKLNKLRPLKVQRFHIIRQCVDFFAPGIFSGELPEWGVERRIVSPAFSHANMDTYIPTVRRVGARLHAVLEKDGAHGTKAVPISGHLQHFAADTISLLGFNHDADSVTSRTDKGSMASDAALVTAQRSMAPLPYWKVPFLGDLIDGGSRVREKLKVRLAEVLGAAKAKRQQGTPGSTMLDKFIEKSEEENAAISDERLTGNLTTLFIAGTETTAITMGWILYDLGRDKQLQADVRAEATAARISDDISFLDVLARLPLLNSIFSEELRLRGPVGFLLFENAHKPIEVAGRVCDPGEYVFVWPMRYLSTREDIGLEPETFQGRRWLSADGKKVLPLPSVAAPFGGSVRVCPAKNLALVEALVCVAEILLRFDVELRDLEPMGRKFAFTMHPSRSIDLFFTPREVTTAAE